MNEFSTFKLNIPKIDIKKNKKFYIQPGNQIRDYLYINDLCKVLILIINNYQKKYNFVLNISSKNYIKIKSIPKMIEKILNIR